jgi:hypothetical protein
VPFALLILSAHEWILLANPNIDSALLVLLSIAKEFTGTINSIIQ